MRHHACPQSPACAPDLPLRRTPGVAWVAALALSLTLIACGGGGGGQASAPEAVPQSMDARTLPSELERLPAAAEGDTNLVQTDHFHMAQGDRAHFDLTRNGQTTVASLRRQVLSGPDALGLITTEEDTGPADQAVLEHTHYVRGSDGLTRVDPSGGDTRYPGLRQALPSWLQFPDRVMRAGEVQTLSRSGPSGADVDGDGVSDDFRLELSQTYLGLRTMAVLGQSRTVAVFRTNLVIGFLLSSQGQRLSATTASEVHAWAAGIGLVAADRGAIRHADGSWVQPPASLRLRAAQLGTQTLGVQTATLSTTALASTLSSLTDEGAAATTLSFTVRTSALAGVPSLTVQASARGDAVEAVTTTRVDDQQTRVDVRLRLGSTLSDGTHTDTVAVQLCLDAACRWPVPQSPLSVAVTTTVQPVPAPEPGMPQLTPASTLGLGHDVVAARFSRALGRLVMVAAWPSPAIYLLDPAAGTEVRIDLAADGAPQTLSMAPDGLSVAVGHAWVPAQGNARLSWTRLDDAGASLIEFGLNHRIQSLSLSGSAQPQVLVADGGSATQSWYVVHVKGRAEYRPSVNVPLTGDVRFADLATAANNSTSSADGISSYAMTQSLPRRLVRTQWGTSTVGLSGQAPDHGDHAPCGELWLSRGGDRLFTGCGTVFSTSSQRDADLLYLGRIGVTADLSQGVTLTALSDSPTTDEVAAIDWVEANCTNPNGQAQCHHHLLRLRSDLSAVSRQALAPIRVNGRLWRQDGIGLYHSADGRHLYMLSRLAGMGQQAQRYWFSVVY